MSAGEPVVPTGWWWQRMNADGAPVQVEDSTQFPTRGDAESWLGEAWSDLAAEGVESVTLFEGDRKVYGPMSLRPE